MLSHIKDNQHLSSFPWVIVKMKRQLTFSFIDVYLQIARRAGPIQVAHQFGNLVGAERVCAVMCPLIAPQQLELNLPKSLSEILTKLRPQHFYAFVVDSTKDFN
ncbi:MAG TPA: hypothetical protein DDY50_02130, partial [Erwinia persicina]|nr:hypothetical protein [Erwinia persicina]